MRLGKLITTVAIAAMGVGIWATSSQAATQSLSGNARFQIGNGLPIPIVLNAPPDGDVLPIDGASVSTTAGGAIKFLAAGQLTHPGTKRTQGVFPQNNAVFQVATALSVVFPAAPGTLSAGGRSGPAVVTWCPGTAVPVAGAPACGVFPLGGTIVGGIRYTATGAQFGGPLPGSTTGLATVALRLAGTPAGPVTAINAFASPAGPGVIGGPFNGLVTTVAAVPGVASGRFTGSAGAGGTITLVGATGLGAGIGNAAISYGAPWTTGVITVLNPAASPAETFMLSGSDLRTVGGLGQISLVSGAVSTRTLSGPNANRGWLNLIIGPNRGVPAVPPGLLAAAAGLLALGGGYLLRRQQGAVA